jgi:spore coat protein A
MFTRRRFIQFATAAGSALMVPWHALISRAQAQIPGGTLAPGDVDKYVLPLVKPPAMPGKFGKNKDKYRIGVRQFQQRILSPPHPVTPVWGYGSIDYPGTVAEGGTFNYPAFTIENAWNKVTQVLWRNELVDSMGNFLPHLLPVDQTLHWANPPGGLAGRDKRGFDSAPYTGPVPMVTHVHGAHTTEDSDGYAEAWYLPDAANIPAGYATTGTFFDYFNAKYGHAWGPGAVSFKYPNDQPASTLWYHDHTLGMTRTNVYAGPAGFWLIRGGTYDMDLGYVAPGVGDDPLGEYTEIPIAIQDRSFNVDGTLYYPDNRAFFEGLDPAQLQIPFIPDEACDGLPSDVSPIWNPEVFGNMMVVNGFTWPYLEVEQRRYRFRFLNGCNSRFLVLKMTAAPRMNNSGFNTPGYSFWQIGAEQGFLPAPVELDYLLMAPAERADVVVDFTSIPVGTEIYLVNDGPDAPFGGVSLEDLADWESTGQVMKFVVKAASSGDTTTPPASLVLPPQPVLPATDVNRQLSLNEEESASVRVSEDASGNIVLDCATGEVFGPTSALLGTLNPDGSGNPLLWDDIVTENPALGATEEWEIHNFTEDAHPIHVHLVKFKVLGRGADGHEDNEMMRPYVVGMQDPSAP